MRGPDRCFRQRPNIGRQQDGPQGIATAYASARGLWALLGRATARQDGRAREISDFWFRPRLVLVYPDRPTAPPLGAVCPRGLLKSRGPASPPSPGDARQSPELAGTAGGRHLIGRRRDGNIIPVTRYGGTKTNDVGGCLAFFDPVFATGVYTGMNSASPQAGNGYTVAPTRLEGRNGRIARLMLTCGRDRSIYPVIYRRTSRRCAICS